MKLQIKTLNQKSLQIDIEDTKTVYELKKELAMYPDVGVKPELQKLIYAGKILMNDDQLSGYNIDVNKFLVVMVLKQPLEESPTTNTSQKITDSELAATTKDNKDIKTTSEIAAAPPSVATTAAGTVTTTTTPSTATESTAEPVQSRNEEMVSNIVSMGYPESEVRTALAASFYNPERAIEYLIEGIPPAAALAPNDAAAIGYLDSDEDLTMSPFEMFRRDPLFRNLRRAIQQHPELIDDAIQRVGEANPGILNLINENQQEFLSMLMEEGSDDDGGDEDEEDDDEEMHPSGI